MIAVIVPFSRPQMAQNVFDNFMRQRLPAETRLVVVENGPGIGGWGAAELQSEHGRSHARTAGLHRARELGCEWFAYWDDDDWYGPGFLKQCWANRERADVVGQCRHVLEEPTGKRWLLHPERVAGPVLPAFKHALVGGIAAATLFGRVDRALDWTAHVPFGEEQFWYTAMYEAGRTLWGIADHDEFVLKRYADPHHGHALPDWRREIKACNGVELTS